MSVRPILFNTDMVRAIMEGYKTVTRRLINPRYRNDESGFQVITSMNGEFIRVEKVDEDESSIFSDGTERYVNPLYQTGDILYVRETWTESCPHGIGACPSGKPKQADRICDVCQHNKPFYYKADDIENKYVKWNPSIHMPKQAARIWLKVTGVRVERLQDISNEQILAEGANKDRISSYIQQMAEDTEEWTRAAYLLEWSNLWDSTVKADWQKWENNPWVWVIEFEQCEKPVG